MKANSKRKRESKPKSDQEKLTSIYDLICDGQLQRAKKRCKKLLESTSDTAVIAETNYFIAKIHYKYFEFVQAVQHCINAEKHRDEKDFNLKGRIQSLSRKIRETQVGIEKNSALFAKILFDHELSEQQNLSNYLILYLKFFVLAKINSAHEWKYRKILNYILTSVCVPVIRKRGNVFRKHLDLVCSNFIDKDIREFGEFSCFFNCAVFEFLISKHKEDPKYLQEMDDIIKKSVCLYRNIREFVFYGDGFEILREKLRSLSENNEEEEGELVESNVAKIDGVPLNCFIPIPFTRREYDGKFHITVQNNKTEETPARLFVLFLSNHDRANIQQPGFFMISELDDDGVVYISRYEARKPINNKITKSANICVNHVSVREPKMRLFRIINKLLIGRGIEIEYTKLTRNFKIQKKKKQKCSDSRTRNKLHCIVKKLLEKLIRRQLKENFYLGTRESSKFKKFYKEIDADVVDLMETLNSCVYDEKIYIFLNKRLGAELTKKLTEKYRENIHSNYSFKNCAIKVLPAELDRLRTELVFMGRNRLEALTKHCFGVMFYITKPQLRRLHWYWGEQQQNPPAFNDPFSFVLNAAASIGKGISRETFFPIRKNSSILKFLKKNTFADNKHFNIYLRSGSEAVWRIIEKSNYDEKLVEQYLINVALPLIKHGKTKDIPFLIRLLEYVSENSRLFAGSRVEGMTIFQLALAYSSRALPHNIALIDNFLSYRRVTAGGELISIINEKMILEAAKGGKQGGLEILAKNNSCKAMRYLLREYEELLERTRSPQAIRAIVVDIVGALKIARETGLLLQNPVLNSKFPKVAALIVERLIIISRRNNGRDMAAELSRFILDVVVENVGVDVVTDLLRRCGKILDNTESLRVVEAVVDSMEAALKVSRRTDNFLQSSLLRFEFSRVSMLVAERLMVIMAKRNGESNRAANLLFSLTGRGYGNMGASDIEYPERDIGFNPF